MNPLIQKQLKKCKLAQIPPIQDNTLSFIIPKHNEAHISTLQVHKCYIIELDDILLDQSQPSALAVNWNKNSYPAHKWYKCEICEVMGNMVKIHGRGFDYINNIDYNIMWSGWLPQKSVRIISELR